ncbi:RTA1-like protein [Ceratobasidium sp. AG-I]|nr:RTA1-like protein [Ceratobasidium sp. AG-I]
MALTSIFNSFLFYNSLGFLLSAACVLAQDDSQYIDPAHDKKNPLRYIPTTPAAVAFGSLYLVTLGVFVILSFRRYGRYMLVLMLSAEIYAAGLFMRLWFAKDTHNITRFIAMNMCTILSPCGFIATVYMLLGRLAIHLEAEDLLLLKPSIITKVFVASDIITFMVQAGGGGLIASSNTNTSKIGEKIFLVGLILQLVSFIIYTLVFIIFIWRLRTQRREQWHDRPDGIFKHWLMLVMAMAISCQGIIIRSGFRTIENAQGFEGKLATTERYFYMMDCFPLWTAIFVFVIVWPPSYLTGYKAVRAVGSDAGVELNLTGSKA